LFTDCRGLEVSAADAQAVRHYDDCIADYLRFATTVGNHLKLALEADPDFLMATCLRGYFFKLFATPSLEIRAQQALEKAESLVETGGATGRERRHVAALKAWVACDMRSAVAHWEAILRDDPRDVLALKLAHYIHFYLGDDDALAASVSRALPSWDADVPGYSYVLGVQAFALEEAGHFDSAETAGREAVDLEPNDPWAIHAVTHVMEMQDRRREGIDWVVGLEPHWAIANNFAFHLWWHRCLMHLELEEYDKVLELYDDRLRREQTEEYLDISNATSLLWRLEERGIGVGARWDELADVCLRRLDDHLLIFADTHYFLALAAKGKSQAAAQCLSSMQAMPEGSEVTQAAVARDVGIPLCEGIAAWFSGDYGAAVDRIAPVRRALHRLGGSHAQLDVFHQILISSALRSGRFETARDLLAERRDAKPRNPWTWKRYADALDGLGEPARAEEARSRAAALLAA
jgi:tetratricopeptide (TPR) repeat protein